MRTEDSAIGNLLEDVRAQNLLTITFRLNFYCSWTMIRSCQRGKNLGVTVHVLEIKRVTDPQPIAFLRVLVI